MALSNFEVNDSVRGAEPCAGLHPGEVSVPRVGLEAMAYITHGGFGV